MIRHRQRGQRRRLWLAVSAAALLVTGAVVLVSGVPSRAPATAPGRPIGVSTTVVSPVASMPESPLALSPGPSADLSLAEPWLASTPGTVIGHLGAGSDPSVLPSDLLIVDKFNNRLVVIDPQGRIRWQFPQPGDLAAGQTFLIPDDAFFAPDGKSIIVTQEDQAVVTIVDIATHRIAYRYGIPGKPGMANNQLNNPDDAMMLPNGYILSADIQNCRLVLISPGTHQPARIIGLTTTACRHAPPQRWGSPNGAFPMLNGHYLVTEINGDWVDELDLNGTVSWSAHPPGVAYPSDSNEISPGLYLTVDYSNPGQVVTFDRTGRKVWSFSGTGRDTLNHPSLALPLPNGDIVLNDDYNHRVIVIDPRTNKIVWQYGVTGKSGTAPGYLNNPDGIDLAPPQSLLTDHAATMGIWP